jgi:hypothetical protein
MENGNPIILIIKAAGLVAGKETKLFLCSGGTLREQAVRARQARMPAIGKYTDGGFEKW